MTKKQSKTKYLKATVAKAMQDSPKPRELFGKDGNLVPRGSRL
jgi:hypothetical protein